MALATDPTSAFGGIIAFNREIDAATVELVSAQFLEVLIAPGYSAECARAHREESQCPRADDGTRGAMEQETRGT